jgi:hypothetical protein
MLFENGLEAFLDTLLGVKSGNGCQMLQVNDPSHILKVHLRGLQPFGGRLSHSSRTPSLMICREKLLFLATNSRCTGLVCTSRSIG